jgi:hypothetical protein
MIWCSKPGVCSINAFFRWEDNHGKNVLTPDLFKGQIERIANNYVMYAGWFK